MKYKSLVAASFAALFLYVAVFAQSVITGTVIKNANLRTGPGTTYAIAGTVKAGQVITITGKNEASTWYHLDGGQWIATFLVKVTDGTTLTPVTPSSTPASGKSQPAATTTSAPTATPLPPPTNTPKPAPTAIPIPTKQSANCDPSYPDFCIPPSPPDLNCPDIPRKAFTVLPPDPHRFDRDHDGIGCES